MPAPLAMPDSVTGTSPIMQVVLAPFGNVSVVMMAAAAADQLSSPLLLAFSILLFWLISATRPSKVASRTRLSSGSPITPVEASNTACGAQPIRCAMPVADAVTVAMPALPVKAFALPAFTRMAAGGWPEASASRDHCTGAAAVSDFVKTAAMLLPLSQCINSISSRPVYFRPDAAVASPRPAIAGMSGKRSGASGDTVIDHPVVRLAVPVHRRPHLQTDACRCRHQRAMSRPRGQRPDAADSG